PAATPRTRPDERPRKLTRRSASPRGNVFRMMASVSLAGMSSRRADAAPDNLERAVRSARTRRAIVITTRAHVAQCFGARFLANSTKTCAAFCFVSSWLLPNFSHKDAARPANGDYYRHEIILLTNGFLV